MKSPVRYVLQLPRVCFEIDSEEHFLPNVGDEVLFSSVERTYTYNTAKVVRRTFYMDSPVPVIHLNLNRELKFEHANEFYVYIIRLGWKGVNGAIS